jgi:hypothetical protein
MISLLCIALSYIQLYSQLRQGVIELCQVLYNDLDIAPTYEN